MDDLLAPDAILVVGITDTQLYGNGVTDLVDDDGRAEFSFLGSGDTLILSFDSYDVDSAQELAIEVNGVMIGHATPGVDNGYAAVSFRIDSSVVKVGTNTLSIVQDGNIAWTWGATNILLSRPPTLEIDSYETGSHGNRLDGNTNSAGVVDFDFDGAQTDLTLFVQGFDIDTSTEVEVFVNAQSLGYLSVSENDGFRLSSFEIDASLLSDGTNTLSFVQTKSPEWGWGVTDIVLYGPGPHSLDVSVDPEFLDEYVVWQTRAAFYMGRIDLNTGLLVETLNAAAFRPTPLGETLQGPEIMRTSDGIIGIGMTPEGLVWFSKTDSGLLEGTEGMILGFLPKGVTPGLRFIMSDADANQYLYDNGTVTLLDLDGGEASSWLNESEVVISYFNTDKDLLTVFDLDTGEMTHVADQAYVAIGQQAAITTESGARYIAINAGFTYDIFRDGPQGWTRIQTITSPDRDWFNIDSVELFEWNGGLFLSGILTDQPGLGTYENTIPVLYDVFHRTWTELAGVGDYMDPEVVVLADGTIAFNYYDINRGIAEFVIVTPEQVAPSAAGFAPALQSAPSAGPRQCIAPSDSPIRGNAPPAPGLIANGPEAAPVPAVVDAFVFGFDARPRCDAPIPVALAPVRDFFPDPIGLALLPFRDSIRVNWSPGPGSAASDDR